MYDMFRDLWDLFFDLKLGERRARSGVKAPPLGLPRMLSSNPNVDGLSVTPQGDVTKSLWRGDCKINKHETTLFEGTPLNFDPWMTASNKKSQAQSGPREWMTVNSNLFFFPVAIRALFC